MLAWNDKNSYDCNVVVQKYPQRTIAKRKYDVVSVPGRNGDLYFSQDAYENVLQEYDVYISAEREKLPVMARKAAEWLSAAGYHELWDSYEPDIFRLAYYAGSQDIENIFNRFGRMKLSFSCKPQRFLITGKDVVNVAKTGTVLHNPTGFAAKPLIRVYGTGSGTLTVGSTTVTLTEISEYIDIDSDLQDAYKGTLNQNSKMTGDFPELASGENILAWTGDITRLTITPRWWTL